MGNDGTGNEMGNGMGNEMGNGTGNKMGNENEECYKIVATRVGCGVFRVVVYVIMSLL